MAGIDIIMSAYNEEKVIERAIVSILEQTYQDWRLLICNDGSKDGTLDILRKYESKYPEKFVIINNRENRGLTYSLNKLISISSAVYIARMDADDICAPQRFEIEKNFLDKNAEYAMVGSNITKFDDDGVFASSKYLEYPVIKDFLWNNPFAHPTVMIRSEVIKGLGGYCDISRTLRCEDYDLWFRLYEKGYKGYNIQESLLYYCESRASYGKRKFKFRLNEAATRFEGYRKNGLLPFGIIFALKPLVIGVIPRDMMIRLRKVKHND